MVHSTTCFTLFYDIIHITPQPWLPQLLARYAMTARRCCACKTRNHPLRWRTLFDCWYCPRCETVRIRVIVNELITELTP